MERLVLGGVRRDTVGERADESADDEPDEAGSDIHAIRFSGCRALPPLSVPPPSDG
jgi:hypothetical protein